MRHASQIHIEGFEHPIMVRHNPRARRFTLRVNSASHQAILTLPPRTKLSEAKNFVADHMDWLQNQLDKIPAAIPFAHQSLIPFKGENHRLIFVDKPSKSRIVTIEPQKEGPATLEVSGGEAHAPRRLLDWLKKEAHSELSARVRWHAENLGLTPKRISVRDQISRWGSCSSTGALSFSWRLILAPKNVLDYVAAHEVAHLAEMNHGPRFWRLVDETMPERKTAQHWLKTHGAQLHRYGPSNSA